MGPTSSSTAGAPRLNRPAHRLCWWTFATIACPLAAWVTAFLAARMLDSGSLALWLVSVPVAAGAVTYGAAYRQRGRWRLAVVTSAVTGLLPLALYLLFIALMLLVTGGTSVEIPAEQLPLGMRTA